MEILKDFLGKVRLYIQVTHLGDIARRYFVLNGFDGAMTVLGVILGAWIVGVDSPNVIVMTGLGACMAMGISGFFGAYITEKAERKRQLKIFEESILTSLDGSIYQDASEFAPAFAALIDGASPALTAIISLIPFILSIAGLISIWNSYIISIILNLTTLFSLGVYLGKIAGENIWLYGLCMTMAGAIIAIIVFALGGF